MNARNFKKADWGGFRNQLNTVFANNTVSLENVQIMYDYLTHQINLSANEHIPYKNIVAIQQRGFPQTLIGIKSFQKQ
jgi:hypothetical protein